MIDRKQFKKAYLLITLGFCANIGCHSLRIYFLLTDINVKFVQEQSIPFKTVSRPAASIKVF